jgi:hypothetical protein
VGRILEGAGDDLVDVVVEEFCDETAKAKVKGR